MYDSINPGKVISPSNKYIFLNYYHARCKKTLNKKTICLIIRQYTGGFFGGVGPSEKYEEMGNKELQPDEIVTTPPLRSTNGNFVFSDPKRHCCCASCDDSSTTEWIWNYKRWTENEKYQEDIEKVQRSQEQWIKCKICYCWADKLCAVVEKKQHFFHLGTLQLFSGFSFIFSKFCSFSVNEI